MGLFFKRKSKHNNFDQYYDEDGYFIDAPLDFGDSDEYNTYNNNDINHFQNRPPIKNRQTKNEINNDGQWENEYYDDYNTDDNYCSYEESKKVRQPVNIKIITVLFLYIIFLIIGIFNTTFESGYVPQIVNATIKSERVIYYKAMDEIKFLEGLDDFKGVQELQELSKTGHYQERIPPLQSALKKVNNELKSLQARAYKIKETDYLKVEMMYMVNDLLTSEASTLEAAIQYYQQLSGYTSSDDPQLTELQNELLNLQNQYKTKMANYKVRFEQIKVNDLLIYD